MRKITVTMTREMYELLLYGRKATKETPGVKACVTHDEVVRYVNQAYGLLGRVADVIAE